MRPRSVPVLVLVIGISSAARAQPAAPPQPAQPAQPGSTPPPAGYPPPGQGMYVGAPPPPPPVDAGRHLHDGFYLRMALGGGMYRATIQSELESVSDRHISGGGLGLDVMVGGTPAHGLVLGGVMLVSGASQPKVESDGQTQDFDVTMDTVMFGPFIDGFFDPRGGFHAGGALGLSVVGYQGPNTTPEDEKAFAGAGIAAWAGYDAWIASDWSLGGYLRLMATSGRRQFESKALLENVKEQADTLSVALLFTALYH